MTSPRAIPLLLVLALVAPATAAATTTLDCKAEDPQDPIRAFVDTDKVIEFGKSLLGKIAGRALERFAKEFRAKYAASFVGDDYGSDPDENGKDNTSIRCTFTHGSTDLELNFRFENAGGALRFALDSATLNKPHVRGVPRSWVIVGKRTLDLGIVINLRAFDRAGRPQTSTQTWAIEVPFEDPTTPESTDISGLLTKSSDWLPVPRSKHYSVSVQVVEDTDLAGQLEKLAKKVAD